MTRTYLAAALWTARAFRRALPDAVDAYRRRGLLRGLQVLHRLAVVDLRNQLAAWKAMHEAVLTGDVRVKEKP